MNQAQQTQPTADEQIESLQTQMTQTAHQIVGAERQVKSLNDNYDALSNALQGVQLGVAKAAADAEAETLAKAEEILAETEAKVATTDV